MIWLGLFFMFLGGAIIAASAAHQPEKIVAVNNAASIRYQINGFTVYPGDRMLLRANELETITLIGPPHE